MYFKTCKENLETKINMVARIVPTRSTVPILENILIRISKGNIFILANNTEIYMKTKITAMALEEGEVTVNGKLFSEIIRKLPDNKEIEIKVNKKELNIIAGKSKVALPYMDAKLYPEPPTIHKDNCIRFTVEGELFRKGLLNTIYAAKKNDDNIKLSSVNLVIEQDKDRLVLCCLDGHRVAKNHVPISKSNQHKNCNIIIPKKTCHEILKTHFDEMECIITDTYITFSSGDFVMISSLIAGKYYDISNYDISNFKTDSTFSIKVDRQTLEDSINRSLVIQNGIQNKKEPLHLIVNKKEMKLHYYTNNGNLSESIEIDGEHEKNLEIGFNPIFLLDAVKAAGDDSIKLNLSQANSPCIIQNDCSMHMILPVALKAS